MNSITVAYKNINFRSVKLIITILLLGIGLAAISSVNYISKNLIKDIEDEYLIMKDDNRIHVTTLQYRQLNSEEIAYVAKIEGVDNIILDYNMSLMFANEEKQVIYQSKIQQFDKSIDFNYSFFKGEKEGIILPDILIEESPYPSALNTYYGKNVYFMIEKKTNTGEITVEEYLIPVIGLYKTKLNQYTSSIYVTEKLLEDIQQYAEMDNNIYGFDILLEADTDVDEIVKEIESIGLETIYAKKTLQSSIDNVKYFVLIIRIFSGVILAMGVILLLLFAISKIKRRSQEIAIMKVLGYSTSYIARSVWIELFTYMFISSIETIVFIKIIFEILSIKELPFSIPYIQIFSNEMIGIFVINIVSLILIATSIVLIIAIQIGRVNPLMQLKDNQNK